MRPFSVTLSGRHAVDPRLVSRGQVCRQEHLDKVLVIVSAHTLSIYRVNDTFCCRLIRVLIIVEDRGQRSPRHVKRQLTLQPVLGNPALWVSGGGRCCRQQVALRHEEVREGPRVLLHIVLELGSGRSCTPWTQIAYFA